MVTRTATRKGGMTMCLLVEIPAAAHSRSCAIFTSGHDADGRFRPVPCDCHISEA